MLVNFSPKGIVTKPNELLANLQRKQKIRCFCYVDSIVIKFSQVKSPYFVAKMMALNLCASICSVSDWSRNKRHRRKLRKIAFSKSYAGREPTSDYTQTPAIMLYFSSRHLNVSAVDTDAQN